jgi:hypothetical protein
VPTNSSFAWPVVGADVWIVSCIIMSLSALPGYESDAPLPKVALWRTIATAFGVALEVVVVSLVLPITARSAQPGARLPACLPAWKRQRGPEGQTGPHPAASAFICLHSCFLYSLHCLQAAVSGHDGRHSRPAGDGGTTLLPEPAAPPAAQQVQPGAAGTWKRRAAGWAARTDGRGRQGADCLAAPLAVVPAAAAVARPAGTAGTAD